MNVTPPGWFYNLSISCVGKIKDGEHIEYPFCKYTFGIPWYLFIGNVNRNVKALLTACITFYSGPLVECRSWSCNITGTVRLIAVRNHVATFECQLKKSFHY